MIDLPPKFKQALGNGVRTSLYPLVRIYKGYRIDDTIPDDAESINLSIKETNISGSAYKPLLLNSPSIKSSADIINNKYTISSVSLSISNAPFQGKIFSDDIQSLLNAVVQVYYCANGIDSIDDCLLVYTGTIRRFSQSAETIKLELEDATQQILSTKIPSTLIPDEPTYLQEDIGKPFPMVYGFVDQSPIITKTTVDVFADSGTEIVSSLACEKPNQLIEGGWDRSISDIYDNIDSNNMLVQDDWFHDSNFLFIYNDGFIPINRKMPKDFAERYTDTDGDEQINISNQYLGEEVYNIDIPNASIYINKIVEGLLPTRIIRPFVEAAFYARNRYDLEFQNSWARFDSNNTIIGFTSHGSSIFDPRELSRYVSSTQGVNNSSKAKDAYEDNWENGNQSWWETTYINDMTSDTGTGEWGLIDVESGKKFNPYWIQNSDDNYGLHINSTNPAYAVSNQHTGCMVKLIFEKVGSFECVSRAHYRLSAYSPKNLGTESYFADWNQYKDIESVIYPSSIWFDGFLIDSGEQENTTQIDLQDMIDNAPDRYMPRSDDTVIENLSILDGTGASIKVEGHQVSGLMKNTNDYLSICWGADNHDAAYSGNSEYAVRTCIASLHQLHLTNDIIIDKLSKQKFYASLRGRVKESGDLIKTVKDIIENILTNELIQDIEEIDLSFANDWIHSFTLHEQKEAKEVFEGLFKSSLIIPSFNAQGQFTFIPVHQVLDDILHTTIDNQDILKYSFSLTKLDDVKNQVNVKYKKNYGSGEFDKETGYGLIDANGNDLGDTYDAATRIIYDDETKYYNIDYYGLTSEEAKLEVETDYIRDDLTARKLQKRLLMWYANQHLITKIDLPASYMNLETGDYIHFDELVGGKLAFGYDYTETDFKNGQVVYPVFFITKISKSLDKVSIEAVQVHRGEYGEDELDYQFGDPNDDSNYGDDTIVDEEEVVVEEEYLNCSWYQGNNNLNDNPQAIIDTNLEGLFEREIFITFNDEEISDPDSDEVLIPIIGDTDEPFNASDYITTTQSPTSITLSTQYLIPEEHGGIVGILRIFYEGTEHNVELDFTQNYVEPPDFMLGDVSGDGIVNVLDVVAIVNHILGGNQLTGDALLAANYNEDGIVNVLDVVSMVNFILAGGD